MAAITHVIISPMHWNVVINTRAVSHLLVNISLGHGRLFL